MAEPGGALVGSGSFRVDRKRALAKLGRYQYQSLNQALVSLVRAAVAGGARRIEVKTKKRALTSRLDFSLRFDGAPLTPKEHRGPFDAIFEEQASPRSKLLAEGLLSLCRRSVEPVRVTAGEGAQRCELAIDLDGDDREKPAAGGSSTAVAGLFRFPADDDPLGLSPGYFHGNMIPGRLTFDGRVCPRLNPRAPGAFFKAGAVRGWVGLPPLLGNRPSQVNLCYLGLGAGHRELRLPFAQVEAWVNDNRARTDLSGLIGGSPRWAKILRLLEVESVRLVLRLADEQPGRLRRAWRTLASDPVAREAWRRREEWGPKRDPDGLTVSEALRATLRGGDARRLRLRPGE